MTNNTVQKNEMIELIDLQSANMTQLTTNGIKGNWSVKKNITGEHLHTLPSHTSDKDAFGILNFARKYELIAFNEGIKFQKEKQNIFFLEKIKNLEKLVEAYKEDNERLAMILEKHLPQED